MSTTTALLAPDKIQSLLDYAAKLGMMVEFEADTRPERYMDQYCWTIGSGKPNDHDRIWIFWNGPGPNGGRTGVVLYRPFAKRKPSVTTKLTFNRARSWMRILSGAL